MDRLLFPFVYIVVNLKSLWRRDKNLKIWSCHTYSTPKAWDDRQCPSKGREILATFNQCMSLSSLKGSKLYPLLTFFLDLLFSNLRLDSTSFRFDKLWRILSPETPDVYDSSDLWQGPQNFDLGIPIVFLTFLTYHEDRIRQNVRNSEYRISTSYDRYIVKKVVRYLLMKHIHKFLR